MFLTYTVYGIQQIFSIHRNMPILLMRLRIVNILCMSLHLFHAIHNGK